MPRGAQVDLAATKARNFHNPWTPKNRSGSFVGRDSHEYLSGRDRTLRRLEVWKRSKHCATCGKFLSWSEIEMDHVQGGLYGRCDCLDCDRNGGNPPGNVQPACRECHRIKTLECEHH